MNRRRIKRRGVDANECSLADLHPVLQRVYAARGVKSQEDLDLRLNRLLPISRMKGLPAAVDLLLEMRDGQEGIVVVGDFDADGATSTALVLRALRSLGFSNVDYLVPNRFEYGYGLTPEIVEMAALSHPSLIITVDNGISSHDGVKFADELGIRVLITDHHLPASTLPQAAAIVNPNLPGEDFPSKHLAGVGVAFYLMAALCRHLGAGRSVAKYLDLVALGTIADVVPLDKNNRILVDQGLRRIRAGRCVPGISALLEEAGRDRDRLVAADLAFAVAPRLNAAGRLDDMSVGIECLLADESAQAKTIAASLSALNAERRDIECRMQDDALDTIADMQSGGAPDELPYGLCLFDESWHQGVVGLVASRVKERIHRPVIAFARADGKTLKGSARSIPGVHIRDVLDAVATGHPGLVEKFGGHAMAAGLSLKSTSLETFSDALNAELPRWLDAGDLEGAWLTDGELEPGELCLAIAQLLRRGGPWGQGFPEPMFDGVFEVCSAKLVGENHLKMRVLPDGGQRSLDAIAFNQADTLDALLNERARLVFRLDVNDYRGLQSAQLIVEHAELVVSAHSESLSA